MATDISSTWPTDRYKDRNRRFGLKREMEHKFAQVKIDNKLDCCPDCDNHMIPSGGCMICNACGFSYCG